MKYALGGHALVGAGVVLAVISGTRSWWSVRLGETLIQMSETTAPTAGMLALVVAIGWLLWATLRHRGRRIVAIVVAVVALVMVGYGLRPPAPSAAEIAGANSRIGSAAEPVLELGGWHWAYAGAGLLIAVGAVITAITVRPRQSSFDRYRRGHHDPGRVSAADDAAQVWRALDAGFDPTVHGGHREPGDPDASVDLGAHADPGESGASGNQNPASGGNLGNDRRQ